MYCKFHQITSTDSVCSRSELPENPESCWVDIEAEIRIYDGEEFDTLHFSFYVTTPKYLTKEVVNDGYLFGNALLIVNKFNLENIENSFRKLASSTTGDSWEEIYKKLIPYGNRWS